MNEKEILEDYLASCSKNSKYYEEVPVGNATAKKSIIGEFSKDVEVDIENILNYSIDALYENNNSKNVSLIESKQRLNHRSIGQVLFYSHLFKVDRSVVREKGWEFDHHINENLNWSIGPDGTVDRERYEPKSSLNEIHPKIVVEEIRPKDTHFLAACHNHGVAVKHKSEGRWKEFDGSLVKTESSGNPNQLFEHLGENDRESLDSEREEKLANEFISFLDNLPDEITPRVYREIPIGKYLFPNEPSQIICDLVVNYDGLWMIVELKKSTHKSTPSDFQRAFGQSVAYSTLFSQEWNIDQGKIIPVICQKPVAYIAGVYRKERYSDNPQKQLSAARQDTTQPVIVGPAERLTNLIDDRDPPDGTDRIWADDSETLFK